jgi:hypothetical protein
MPEAPQLVCNLGKDPKVEGAYIGREWAGRKASEWANPHRVGHDTPANRRRAVWAYFLDLMNNPVRLRIHELRGKPLLCWCAPGLCHGHALAWILAHQEFHGKPCPRCGQALQSRMNFHEERGWNLLYEQGPCPSCSFYCFRHAARGFTIDTIEEWAKVER